MLSFDEEIVNIKFKGKEYKISKPNNGQIKEYSLALKDANDDESKEKALTSFLENLGLVKEVYDSLTPSQMKTVLSSLYDSEKN